MSSPLSVDFTALVDSDPALLDVQTTAAGPAGSLPLTEELLREAPSGDLFGWTQDAGMHSLFPGLVAEQVFLPRPPAARLVRGRFGGDPESDAETDAWVATAERVIAEHQDTVAGIVVEPVLQGAGGMHVYPPRCLAELRRIADRHGLLLIADEIATGFGRTGAGFAVDWAGVAPDVMCVGKALTGGYLTLAAVLCTSRVADAITRSPQGALLHGPTFMANPLACA
ncbi:MAG: aminotransferase class III-fold pyridoxal phosphate-dependent enzyme, partial [Gemmataceae bacterium]